MKLQQQALHDETELTQARDAVRNMEEEVYKKNKELKDVNKLWEELKIAKQMEEATAKKL